MNGLVIYILIDVYIINSIIMFLKTEQFQTSPIKRILLDAIYKLAGNNNTKKSTTTKGELLN